MYCCNFMNWYQKEISQEQKSNVMGPTLCCLLRIASNSSLELFKVCLTKMWTRPAKKIRRQESYRHFKCESWSREFMVNKDCVNSSSGQLISSCMEANNTYDKTLNSRNDLPWSAVLKDTHLCTCMPMHTHTHTRGRKISALIMNPQNWLLTQQIRVGTLLQIHESCQRI